MIILVASKNSAYSILPCCNNILPILQIADRWQALAQSLGISLCIHIDAIAK